MARPPIFSAHEKQRIVLSVLRGEVTVAEAARRDRGSETSVAKPRDQFRAGGRERIGGGPAAWPVDA